MNWLIISCLGFLFCLAPAAYGDQALDSKLYSAAGRGNLQEVQGLLAKGANVNFKNPHGYTPLHTASSKGSLPVVEVLLASGADVNARTDEGYTPLMNALIDGHPAVAQALLAKGADVNARTIGGQTALMSASQKGYLPIVQALLAKGADVNAKYNPTGNTALMSATWKGDVAIVQALLAKGADVNAKDSSGRTALESASKDKVEVIQALKAAIEKEGVISSRKDTDQGVAAVQQKGVQEAIPHFQKALDKAPGAPEVLFNMGLAESKLPGHELRAMALFRAYVLSSPHADNINKVRQEITNLETRFQDNLTKLVNKAKQLAAQCLENTLTNERAQAFEKVAIAQARAGDIAGAKRTAKDAGSRMDEALSNIAVIQYDAGDKAGARDTINAIRENVWSSGAYEDIAYLQAIAGDFAGAEATMQKVTWTARKADGLTKIAWEKARVGRRDEALTMCEKIFTLSTSGAVEDHMRSGPLFETAQLQSMLGDNAGAQKTAAHLPKELAAMVNYRDPLNLGFKYWMDQKINQLRGPLTLTTGDRWLVQPLPASPKDRIAALVNLVNKDMSGKLFTDPEGALKAMGGKTRSIEIVTGVTDAIKEMGDRYRDIRKLGG